MGLLSNLKDKAAQPVEEAPQATFVRAKGDFVALSHVKLSGVQVNVGYMTLDGKPEIKAYKIDSKEHKGTPLRLKITLPGKAKGASLVSGRHPLAYYFAQAFTTLTFDAFEAALTKAAEDMRNLGLSPVFNPVETE